MRFREVEEIILADGWQFKNTKGSHCHYTHPSKPGKGTIPNHPGDIAPQIVKRILEQAGLLQPGPAHRKGGIPHEINLSRVLLPG